MRDHLGAGRHIDPVVARMLDRRRRDPEVDLSGAGIAQHPDDLASRVAADDRVVDDHQPLAGDDLGQRVELQPQALAPQLLTRLDERPRDVAVFDEPVVLGQSCGPRQPARGGVSGVRHRNHEVGVDRRFTPQDLAHPRPRDLQPGAAHPRVRPREVDVLEDAERPPLAAVDIREVIPRWSSVTISPGSTSRRNSAPIRSNAHDSLATQ